MDYYGYEKHRRNVEFLEDCMNGLEVRLMAEQFKLNQTKRIGFMGKGNPRTGEPGPGRPPGLKNKRTQEIIERVEWVLSLLEDTLKDDINKLKPAERARMWEALQEYIRPKLQRTEIKADVNTGPKLIGFKDESESE